MSFGLYLPCLCLRLQVGIVLAFMCSFVKYSVLKV